MFTLAENKEVGKELRATVVDALKAVMEENEKSSLWMPTWAVPVNGPILPNRILIASLM